MQSPFVTKSGKGVTPELIDEIINASLEIDSTKAGGNNKCKLVTYKGKEYAVLSTYNIECFNTQNKRYKNANKDPQDILAQEDLSFIEVMERTSDFESNNAVPILGFSYDSERVKVYNTSTYSSAYANGFIVQPRAEGEELYASLGYITGDNPEQNKILIEYQKKYTSITPSQFEAFVKNYYEISKVLMVDPSKRANFFYDENKGFSFIDLNFLRHDNCSDEELKTNAMRYVAMQFRPESSLCFDRLNEEEKETYADSTVKIYKNMIEGFERAGYSVEEIASTLDERIESNAAFNSKGITSVTQMSSQSKEQ